MAIKIKPSDRNTNRHTHSGMELLSKSVSKVGAIESISVTEEGTIISGHARKETFDKLGMKPVEVTIQADEYPVIVRNDIKDNTKQYYEAQILANTTAKKNIDIDTELIEEIAVEYDLDIEELGVEIEQEETHLEAEEDDFDTTPPETPKTVLGDLYEIGEHRLLCGDSTDSDAVARLMNGEKADMVFTDPPYGISHSGKGITAPTKSGKIVEGNNFGKILGDGDIIAAIDSFNLIHSLYPDALHIWWGANYYSSILPNGFGWLVWDKERVGDTFSGAELAFVNKGIKVDVFRHMWHGIAKASESGEKRLHPTQKPLALVEWCFNNYKAGDLILDAFLGSGSTMVAAHQLKRKCYGMELDPKYCDVIVKRMITLDPTLKINLNGIDVTKEWLNG